MEGGIVGSISMKEASSREVLKELAQLISKDDLMFTNQLYEKLSMDRGWEEASMADSDELSFVKLWYYNLKEDQEEEEEEEGGGGEGCWPSAMSLWGKDMM